MSNKVTAKNAPKGDMGSKVKGFVVTNIVPIVFSIVCLIGVYFSGSSIPIILMDVVARFNRNAILVLSLIIPILSGMGLNFGIVLGAMSGQIALFIVTVMEMSGIGGVLLAMLLSIPFAIVFGYFTGKLLNKTKGQEMITGLILGFFANGLYQFLFLYVLGGIIKIDAPGLMIGNGVGVRSTIDLAPMKYALDRFTILNVSTEVDIFTAMMIFGAVFAVFYAVRIFIRKNTELANKVKLGVSAAVIAIGAVCINLDSLRQWKVLVKVPMLSYSLILLVCLLIPAILRTKLGQDLRAVGQNMGVSSVAGINVDRTRIVAVCISTILAAIGQIIFLQNMGNISTYNAHENVGMFSAAAILIGGATVSKATVGQALLGTLLFHLLFNVSPMAGKNLFGSAEIGEYFRVFIAYGIIAVALALYAWKQSVQAKARLKED